MFRVALASVLISTLCSLASADTLNSALVVNGAVTASKPAKIEFEFVDAATGGIAHHFHSMHGKPMHLIVVSEDLSHFAHVHPIERPHSAKAFYLNANAPTADPDNFALPNLFPFGGNYFLFGEVMPMGYGMLNFPYELTVAGASRPAVLPMIDKPGADGKILKYFTDGGSASNETDAKYLLKIEVLPMEHCQVVIPRVHVELLVREVDAFIQVKDLEPWLESYGHAILIGREGTTAAEKAILHLHAAWPLPTGDISKDERGPYLELATHSHGKSMQSDNYRAWIQIKHQGKVQTFAFEFDWDLKAAKARSIPSSALCLH